MASSRTSRAVSGTITAFLQYGLQMLLQVALAPIVLKYAGKETLGAYAIITQVVGQLALLDFGFSTTLMRYLSNAFGCDDSKKRFGLIFTTGRSFLLITNILLSLAIILMSIFVGKLFSLSSEVYYQARVALILLAIWTAFRTPIELYDMGLFSLQNQKVCNIFAMIKNSLRLVLSLVLVILGADLIGLMVANIIAELSGYIMSRIYFKYKYSEIRIGWGFPDSSLFKQMLRFGFQIMMMNIISRFIFGSDNIIAGYLFNATAVASYYATQMPTFAGFVLVWKISDNATPAINELVGANKTDTLRNAYKKLYRYNLLMTLPIAIGIIIFNKLFVTLWVGSAQYVGNVMTYSLAIFFYIVIITHLNAAFLWAFAVLKPFIYFGIFEIILKFSLSYILGRSFGIGWIMVASFVAAIPGFLYISIVTNRRLKLPFKELFNEAIKPACMACSFLSLYIIFISIYDIPLNIFTFMLSCAVYLITFLVGMFIWGITASERTLINSYLFKIRGYILNTASE